MLKRCVLGVTACLALLAPVVPAWSQQQDRQKTSLVEVLRRLEAIERENARLRREVDRLRQERPTIQTEELKALVKELVAKERVGLGRKDFRVYWKNGLRFETPNPAFKLQVGGRIMNDWAFFSTDADVRRAFGDPESGTEFRRARIFLAGQLYDNVHFKAQYDFAGGDADFKDVWIALTDVPILGRIKVGNQKEPFSLEEQTSSKYITFMERGLPNIFSPGRHVGVTVGKAILDGRATWAAGIFRATDGFGEGGGSGHQVTGRLTCLPIYLDDGAQLLHLGAAYSHVSTDTFDFEERPEAHLSEKFLATGELPTADYDLLGAELALVLGPFSLQGEYIAAFVNPTFQGFYLYASYFLTGEHRPYKKSAGAFSRVKPKANFGGEEGGAGAWEVAARYSYVDLDSGGVDGGELSDYTLGLNWYLNPNTRVMFNYVLADPSGLGESHAFMVRFQVDF